MYTFYVSEDWGTFGKIWDVARVRILILSPSRFEPYRDVFREGRGNFRSVLLSSLACVFMITGLWHIHCGHLTFKSGYFNEANYLNLCSCIFLFCIQKVILSSGYEQRFHNFLLQPRNPQLKRNFMPRPIGQDEWCRRAWSQEQGPRDLESSSPWRQRQGTQLGKASC